MANMQMQIAPLTETYTRGQDQLANHLQPLLLAGLSLIAP